MAADTREDTSPKSSESGSSAEASSARKSETYETFNKRLPNANVLPGGTTNTAGGRPKEVSLVEAVKTVQLEDFRNIHKLPCVRDSLLTGILSGFGLGGLRAVLGAPLPRASNWAVGGFCISAFTMYEYCHYQRRREKDGMKRAVELLDRKKIEREREKKMEVAREERRKAKEEADKLAEEEERKKKSKGWKFW
ncbi:MAG: hypothetical protein M1812_000251 [Candelaria pacifica]|nr:MAG: hypothetical protein M1812_000251 [Candelaria pacifica]